MLRMSTAMAETIGVVLCGGESSRMGRDKGLILDNGITWAERAASLLAAHAPRVVYSIREGQLSHYAHVIKNGDYVTDTQASAGPLGGLISVHNQFPHANLLLLACDMTCVTATDLTALCAASGEIVAYRHNGHYEPLCAWYSAAACREIVQRVQENPDRLPGLQRLLHAMRVTALHPIYPKNLESRNTPEL